MPIKAFIWPTSKGALIVSIDALKKKKKERRNIYIYIYSFHTVFLMYFEFIESYFYEFEMSKKL